MNNPSAPRLSFASSLAVAALLAATAAHAAPAASEIKVRGGPAAKALRDLALQTGVNILFTQDDVRGVRVAAIQTRQTAENAARIMLRGTSLEVMNDGAGGLVVRTAAVEPAPRQIVRASFQRAAQDQGAPAVSEPAPMPPTGLEEVIVTARRVEERLQDVPVAITALTGAAIASKSIINSQDLQYHIPGLTATSQTTGATAGYSIRAQSNTLNCAQFCAVVPYMNDVPYSRRFPSLFDIESVQVLKGPQGVAFGRNTTGGAILINTKRPTNRYEGYVNVRAGNMDFKELDAAVNIPLSDIVAVRAAYQIVRRDGYTKELTFGQDLDNISNENYRLTVVIRPTERFNTTFIGGYFNDDSNGTGTVLAGLGARSLAVYTPAAAARFSFPQLDAALQLAQQQARGPRVVRHSMPTYTREERRFLQNQTVWEVNDNLSFKNIASIMRFWTKQSSDSDGSWVPMNDTFTFQPTAEQQLTEEFQIHADAFDDKVKLIGGLYVERTDLRPQDYEPEFMIQGGISFGGPAGMTGAGATNPSVSGVAVFYPELGFGGPGKRWSRTRAVFAQGQFDLGGIVEGLKLTAGARRTFDELFNYGPAPMFTGGNFTGGANVVTLLAGGNPYPWPLVTSAPACAIAGGTLTNCVAPVVKVKSEGWSYAVTLDYQVADKVMVYLSHRKGYRAGTYNSPLLTSQVEIPPETVRDLEPGIKADYDIGSMRARTNAAGYIQWYKDIQQAVTVLDPVQGRLVSITASAANAVIKGFEIEQTLIPMPGLEINAFAAYNDNKYKNIANATLQAQLGDRLPFQPKWQYGVNMSYAFHDLGIAGEIIPSLNYTYRTMVAFNGSYKSEPLAAQPGYSLLDGRIDFKDIAGSRVDGAIFGRNLTNKTYAQGASAASATAGFTSVMYAPPRTYGIELRYAFGE